METEKENPNGLHHKYMIRKADGSQVDQAGVYFVLRLDGKNCIPGSESLHRKACREAALAYCQAIIEADERSIYTGCMLQVARELRELVMRLKGD